MQNPFGYIKESAAATVGRLTVGGALTPFLWLFGMALLFLVPAAFFSRAVPWLAVSFIGILAYLAIIASIAGLRLIFKKSRDASTGRPSISYTNADYDAKG